MIFWHEEYLGIPWSHNPDPPRSFNCGELLRHIYKKHFGYDAPLILADTKDIRSCIRDVENIKRYAEFYEVEVPKDFDIAVMSKGGRPNHVGICAYGDILHCHSKISGVTLDSIISLCAMGWSKISYLRKK